MKMVVAAPADATSKLTPPFINTSNADSEQFALVMLSKAPSPTPGPTPVPVPTPGPNPTPSPGASSTPSPSTWTPINEDTIKALYTKALNDNHGDVSKAFAELRDMRDKPENYYNTNLAIAADYLRARWETQRCGPEVATAEVEGYMALKQAGGVKPQGPGPVSPYSPVEQKYMEQGIADEANTMSFWTKLWWASPAGEAVGSAQALRGGG